MNDNISKIIKVAIYVRVSTTEQAVEGYSIPAQITTLKHYCTGFQYIVYKVYHDAGISGKNIKDRPGLLQLIEDAKENKFDAVLVWKLSRLSRSLLDLLSVVDIFTQQNIAFISYSEKFDTSTPTGKMLLQMLGSIAEFERNTIIENVKLALNERFQQGLSKGAIPFGYVYQDKKVVVIPDQAEQIKHLFNTYDNSKDGMCLTELAEQLNLKGYRTRYNGLWSRDSVKDILSNHFYAGYVRTNVKVNRQRGKNITILKGQHDPIVSEELFYSVYDKLNSKKHAIRNLDNGSLVTGLIACPLCGKKMHAHWNMKKYKKKDGTINEYDNNFYRCRNRKGRIGCKGINVAAHKIDCYIVDLLNKFKSKRFLNSLSKEINAQIKSLSKANDNNKLEILDKQLKDAYVLKDKYFKLFDTGKVEVEKFADKINEILVNIDELEALRDQEIQTNIDYTDTDIVNTWLEYIKENIFEFDNMDNQGKKEFVRQIIKEVNINENKELVSIEFVIGIKIYCT